MADVVLIRPAYSHGRGFLEESRPPAGLLYIAAPLVENEFDVVIVDQTVERNWEERLLSALDKKTLCVGITCLTGIMIIKGLEIAKLVRKHSNCPIVWGGAHPSLEPDTTIESEHVDIIVDGEGEETFLELVKAFKNSESIESINGIIYQKEGKICKNNQREVYDLNNLPPLPLHLVNLDCYRGHPKLSRFFRFKNPLALSIETSRGCTHRCTYCVMANKNKKHRWRSMSASKLTDTIEGIIRKYEIKAFTFIDDNFFVDIDRVKEFLDEIERRNLDIEWFADIRMDTIEKKTDEAFLKRLEKAGLRSLGIGIESGSDRMLKFIRKGETRKTYIEANRMLAVTSIVPQYGIIQGLPSEKLEDVEETYTLAAKLFMDNPNTVIFFNKLLPTPNTPLFEECTKRGFVPPRKFEDWREISDTRWNYGPAIWMDKEAVALIMSLLYYHGLAAKSRSAPNNEPIFEIILKVATKSLLYRIKKKNFYFFKAERVFYKISMIPAVYRFLNRIYLLLRIQKKKPENIITKMVE